MRALAASISMLAIVAAQAQSAPTDSVVNATASASNAVMLTPEYIGRLAEEMLANHPALRAARARTNAAAASVQAVRTWEDPMARLGAMAADQDMRATEGDLIYGIEQKLPLFGKPHLARQVARAELATAAADADYEFQLRRSEFAKAAFQTALAGKVAAIGEQDLSWLELMVSTLDGKYRADQATLVEVFQVQNERAKRTAQLRTDRDVLEQQRVVLNRMLNRDLQSPWPAFELPPVAGPVLYSARLARFAADYEPKLRVLRGRAKEAEAMMDSTRREWWPEVTVGVDSRNYSGSGDWRQTEVMVGFSLPIFNTKKYRADLRRDEARLQAAEFDAADYELALREEVHGLTVKIGAARREALLYRDEIIPRSESALSAAQAGWEANRNVFRDVLDARRMLLEARLMQARAVAEQYQMMSELVLCCGLGDLEALQMIGAAPEAEDGGMKP